jgi:hypothetical protein
MTIRSRSPLAKTDFTTVPAHVQLPLLLVTLCRTVPFWEKTISVTPYPHDQVPTIRLQAGPDDVSLEFVAARFG